MVTLTAAAHMIIVEVRDSPTLFTGRARTQRCSPPITVHTESPYVYTHPRGRPAPSRAALRTGGDEAILVLDTRRSVQLYLAQGRVKRVHCGREL